MKALPAAVVAAFLASGTPAAADTPHDRKESTVVDHVRELFPKTRHWFRIVGGGQFYEAPDGRLVPDHGSLTHDRVRRVDNAGYTIVPYFPRSIAEGMRVESSAHHELYIEVIPEGALASSVEIHDGMIAYPDAYPDTHVLYKSTPTHTDEYLLLESEDAPTTWRFHIDRGPGIVAIVQAGNSVEAVDSKGVAWLRAARPFAIDQSGRRAYGTIVVDGDYIELSIDTSELELPILVDPDWASTGDMAHGRFYFGTNLLPDGRVLATGGCSASICSGDLTLPACPTSVRSAEALDLDSRTWSQQADATIGRFFHASESLPDGSVVIAGGCMNASCSTYTDSVEWFNPSVPSFSPMPALSAARGGISSVALDDGRILLAGGCWNSGCTAAVDIFDPNDMTTTPVAGMQTARGRASATLLDDGRVLVVGGCSTIECFSVLSNAEIYDPVGDVWTPAGAMSTARAGHFAAKLLDGRVLVGGGCPNQMCQTFLDSAEIYDPAMSMFVPTGTMTQPRLGAVAATLPDGDVLVSQGCEGRTQCDLSTEIYSGGTFTASDSAVTTRAFHSLVVHRDRRLAIAIGGCQPGTCSWWNETWDISEHMNPFDPDAGPTPDAGPAPDAGPGVDGGGGGCCESSGGSGTGTLLLALAVVAVVARRRGR